jgi:nucleoside-diphosphate-sugar epimerase
MKILIIGKNSFIGNNIIEHSRYKDIDQISLLDTKPSDIDFTGINIVIHLAAIVHQSKKIPESEYFKINRDLCLDVAVNAKKAGVKQFIFLSTVKVYGECKSESEPLTEDFVCVPNDSYGKSKLEAENGLRKLEDENFSVSIIRTALVYGIGVKANMLSILKLVDKVPFLPFNNINNRRSFTYIENLVAYIDCIIEKKASGIFLAKDNESLSTTTLVKLISKQLGKKVILFKMPYIFLKICRFIMPNIIDRLYGSFEINNKKTIEILNFKVPFTAEEGVSRMVTDYKRKKVIKKRF